LVGAPGATQISLDVPKFVDTRTEAPMTVKIIIEKEQASHVYSR